MSPRAEAVLYPHVLHDTGGAAWPVEWGRVAVPERHAEPDGPRIELAFVRFPHRGRPPGRVFLHLAGGPGVSAVDAARRRAAFYSELSLHGDVVCLDQRGIGASRPNLVLPDRWDFPFDRPLQREALLARAEALSLAGRAFWQQRGVRPEAYVPTESADDVEHLRRALGAERFVVFGGSYGSHLTFSVLRRHPHAIERALLGGIEGPDHTLKLPSTMDGLLAELEAMQQADAAWRGRPPLRAALRGALQRLRKEPVRVGAGDDAIVLGDFDLQWIVAEGIGRLEHIRALPQRVAQMAAGDFAWLAESARRFRRSLFGNAMTWVADCAAGGTPQRVRRLQEEAEEALLGDAIDLPVPHVREAWGVDDMGDDYRAPLTSDTPLLLMSGTLDGRTPPANAEEMLPGLSRAAHLVVEGASHDTLGRFERVEALRSRAVDFLVDGRCRSGRVALPFTFAPPL